MDWLSRFNRSLSRELSDAQIASPRLREALLYATSSPGKRLRPLFVLESGARFGLSERAIELCAISIESVHLFSLIHDDLPALDNDDFRRGLPTLHRKFDEGTALLAGDDLLNLAYSFFFQIGDLPEKAHLVPALKYFSHCIGNQGMIGGQMLELELLRENQNPDLRKLLQIQDLKTGALFRASVLTPLLLSGKSTESSEFKELELFAKAFGFAFQIADDLDDEEQDQRESRKNILTLMGREAAITMAINELQSQKISKDFTATAPLLSRLQSKT